MAFLNHLFLTDILEAVRSEFSTINRELQRVINRTDLNLIFPLTKISKIKQLEENDKTFSILRIEQLSFLHYNLVHQLHQVNKLFDITIIISMMLWFGYVIILTYQFMETVVDGYTLDFAATFYLTTNLLFFYLWLLILIRTFSRTQREVMFRFRISGLRNFFRRTRLLPMFTKYGISTIGKDVWTKKRVICNWSRLGCLTLSWVSQPEIFSVWMKPFSIL